MKGKAVKRLIWVLSFLFLAVSIGNAGVAIDISGSQYETKSTDTMRIRNVAVPGFPDKCWVDFKWDPLALVFAPVSAGLESIKTSFTYEDFSGKSIYYVDKSIYQLAVFYPDGTVQASNMMTSGTPVLMPYPIAIWNISPAGELLITSAEAMRYALISDDTASRYYRVNKYSPDGDVEIVGFFYDQTTGLAQAQEFVAKHQKP